MGKQVQRHADRDEKERQESVDFDRAVDERVHPLRDAEDLVDGNHAGKNGHLEDRDLDEQ